MTPQAQNSLLKKLEEPPANNYLILDVQKPRTLLRTILSRCLVLYLSKPGESTTIEFEDYLHSLSNSDEAKKYLSKIEQLFGETESKGAAFLSFLRQILVDGTPLPDEEKLLLCAYALKEKRPDIAHEILVQNDNPQRLSIDACYYHMSTSIVN